MKPRGLRRHSALIVGAALITFVAMPLSAVGHPQSSNGTASARAQYADVVLDPDAAERVVVVVVRFPVGTAQDPVDREGAAFLLGRTLEGQGNRTLLRLGASVRIDVDADEFLVTMISDPQGWQQAVRELEALLFRDGVSVVDLEFARAELLEVLEFEAGAPVRAFELERERFLLGASHPAARPWRGTPASVESIGVPELEGFRSRHLRAEDGVLAARGPLREEELSLALSHSVRDLEVERNARAVPALPIESSEFAPSSDSSDLQDVPLRPPDSLPAAPLLRLYRTAPFRFEIPSGLAGSPAWTVGERVLLDRELTSTWISVAFPFPVGMPQLLLDFLSHLVTEDLTPSPPDPGLFEAQVSQMDIRGAAVLIVTASVDPRATPRWEERLNTSVTKLAEAPPDGAFFELAHRRFRASVLLESAVPEHRAQWLARQVAAGRDPTADVESELWGLSRPVVAEAAALAGPSRTILFGPRDMMER